MKDFFLWQYYDKSKNGPSVRSPNEDVVNGDLTYHRFPPFTPRTYFDSPRNEWYPLYAPHDATDTVQGITWLTDTYDGNLTASRGMTAMTPYGVGNYVQNNALVKNSQTPQTVEGPVNFSGKVTFSGEEMSGIASKLQTPHDFKVNIGSSSSNTVSFDGTQDVMLTIDSIDAGSISGGVLPLSVIPQGALERLIRVPTIDAMYALTKDQVQTGDMVKINAESDGRIFVVIDDTKLSSPDGYEPFAAGTSTVALQADEFSSARTIKLTGDVTGSATSTGRNGWNISTAYSGVVPIDKGGTGATSYGDLRDKLGLGSDASAPLPISSGGTGATTEANAIKNLGINATAKELNYCSGLTSSVQDQLDGKALRDHNHSYAGSNSAGGAALKVAGLASAVNAPRHVWFSDSAEEEKRCYNENFTYNPSSNTISCNISGKADVSTKVAGGSTVGGLNNPVYVDNGVLTPCANSVDPISDEDINKLF